MLIKDLYDVIRKEGICLWIGSGFSAYAGYPTAQTLKDSIFNSLSNKEQIHLNKSLNLKEFAEDYTFIKNRKSLIDQLQKHFQKPPTSSYYHDLLSRIPHFQSIITTNYDQLIENSYTRKATVIISDVDVARVKESDTKIYKIHGDIDKPDTVVITSADYSKMHNRGFKDPFWSAIIQEISTKHIIFLGYGFEDENIWADFDYVHQKLGDNQKRRFMVSRNTNELKAKKLKQKNIEFIQCSGESFIADLVEYLKLHVADDLRNNHISIDLAEKFYSGFDMRTEFTSSKLGAEILSISKVNGITEHSINLAINDQNTIAEYNNFLKGYDSLEMTLHPHQLKDFTLKMEGFVVQSIDSLSKLKLMHEPNFNGFCTIEFPKKNADFELTNVKYEVYNSIVDKTLIKVEIHGFKIEINCALKNKNVKIDLKFTEPETAKKIKYYCEVFQAISWMLAGEEIQCSTENETKINRLSPHPEQPELRDLFEFYTNLVQIERKFNIKLPKIKINHITAEDRNQVRKLTNLIKNGYHAIKDNDAKLTIELPSDPKIYDLIKKKVPTGNYFIIQTSIEKSAFLFGIQIQLGAEKIAILEPKLISRNLKKRTAVLSPKDSIIIYSYANVSFDKLEQPKVLWTIEEN